MFRIEFFTKYNKGNYQFFFSILVADPLKPLTPNKYPYPHQNSA